MSLHRFTRPDFGTFKLPGPDEANPPPDYSVVKDEGDQVKIRMLEQMVEGLVEENARKDEEILRLRRELDLKK